MDGGARLIELKDGGCDGMTSELNEGGARLIELSEGGWEGMTNELSEGGARLIELRDGGCEGITNELSDGGCEGMTIELIATLIELNEGGWEGITNELKDSGCEGMTIELMDGGARLIVDGIVIKGGARLKGLREGRAVLMDSDPIDEDGGWLGMFKDESPARIPLMPMLEMRGVGIDRKPVGFIDEGGGTLMDGMVMDGIVTLAIGRMPREVEQDVEDSPPMATRLQFPYGATATPLFVGSKTA
jgi:hypothetical protein